MQTFKKLFFRLTGGRPMEHTGLAFPDPLTGQTIHIYKDRLNGLIWASSHPWKSYRRPIKNVPCETVAILQNQLKTIKHQGGNMKTATLKIVMKLPDEGFTPVKPTVQAVLSAYILGLATGKYGNNATEHIVNPAGINATVIFEEENKREADPSHQVGLLPLADAIKKQQKVVGSMELVLAHLRLAEEQHPDWPTDPIHAAAVVSEEAGELVRACNRLAYEGAKVEEAIEEAAQTAAMGIRLLMNINTINKSHGDTGQNVKS
jgi:hypothetical protein